MSTPSADAGAGQRRLFLVVALLVMGGALAAIASGALTEEIVYYWGPTEVLEAGAKAQGADIRLAGVVVEGSKQWDEQSHTLRFDVSDTRHTISVVNKGAPPQMFREGIGVVVEGTLKPDGTFESYRLMVKHSNEYKAPQEGVASENLYRTVEEL